MTTAAPKALRASRTLDAIDTLDLLATDDALSIDDACELNPELLAGLLDYVGYLEAALSITRACDVSDVRSSGRASARLLGERPDL